MGNPSKPVPAQSAPRRDPMIAGAIEALRDADDAIRRGNDPAIELIAAEACIRSLMDKHIGRRK